ncbi:Cytochrome P450 [Macrophomina phaseolina MS6]|uniref:Cytochrome P450 n=1 Tax=Macrophomina phaseolina (strain MS6) TaxID=1126212 RepID=K2RVM5_MACPH|nr:Cytochrome P450 [Macrophomina phaseolina MS6]
MSGSSSQQPSRGGNRARGAEEMRRFSSEIARGIARITLQEYQRRRNGTQHSPIVINDDANDNDDPQQRMTITTTNTTTNNTRSELSAGSSITTTAATTTPNNRTGAASNLDPNFGLHSFRPGGLTVTGNGLVENSDLRTQAPPWHITSTAPRPAPRAPPGPSERFFVYADEREAYLRSSPADADFSHRNPHHLTPGEAELMRDSFILTGQRLERQRAREAEAAGTGTEEAPAAPAAAAPGALPHVDPEDESDPEHYRACEGMGDK